MCGLRETHVLSICKNVNWLLLHIEIMFILATVSTLMKIPIKTHRICFDFFIQFLFCWLWKMWRFELIWEKLPIPLVTYHSISSKHNFREERRKHNLQESRQAGSIGGLSLQCKATWSTLQGSTCGLFLQHKATTRIGKRTNNTITPLHFHKRRPAYWFKTPYFS